jgi:hypothetical protein
MLVGWRTVTLLCGTPVRHMLNPPSERSAIIANTRASLTSFYPTSPDNGSMTIRSDLSLGSDHLLVLTTFRRDQIEPSTTPPATGRFWNFSRLQEDGPRRRYIRAPKKIDKKINFSKRIYKKFELVIEKDI